MAQGVTFEGNHARLQQCLRCAALQKPTTLAFFGGSITEGCAASSPELSYAGRVADWWKRSYPDTNFSVVSAGIGGTTSHYGAARAARDVIAHQPDFVVVDFSVNDCPGIFFRETFEGVVRQLLAAPSHPAIVILHNAYYDTGITAQKDHQVVAQHYGIPCLSVRDGILPLIDSGQYQRQQLTSDNLHPNDLGHQLLAALVTDFLEEVCCEPYHACSEMTAFDLPLPCTVNAYEACRVRQANDLSAIRSGFSPYPFDRGDRFSGGWTAVRRGSKILFSVFCSELAVQYRKTIHRPAPIAEAILDGNKARIIYLNANFHETWGDTLFLQPVLYHGIRKEHTLEIELTEEAEQNEPFYLTALLLS